VAPLNPRIISNLKLHHRSTIEGTRPPTAVMDTIGFLDYDSHSDGYSDGHSDGYSDAVGYGLALRNVPLAHQL
jgi:hypothetical protein